MCVLLRRVQRGRAAAVLLVGVCSTAGRCVQFGRAGGGVCSSAGVGLVCWWVCAVRPGCGCFAIAVCAVRPGGVCNSAAGGGVFGTGLNWLVLGCPNFKTFQFLGFFGFSILGFSGFSGLFSFRVYINLILILGVFWVFLDWKRGSFLGCFWGVFLVFCQKCLCLSGFFWVFLGLWTLREPVFCVFGFLGEVFCLLYSASFSGRAVFGCVYRREKGLIRVKLRPSRGRFPYAAHFGVFGCLWVYWC